MELCLLLQELGRVVAPLPAIPTLVMGALPIVEFGSSEQRARFLPRVATGELVLSAALVERGVDDAALPTTQARQKDGDWLLEGEKLCVPAAHLAERIVKLTR